MTTARSVSAQLAAIARQATALRVGLDGLWDELEAAGSGLRASGYEARGGPPGAANDPVGNAVAEGNPATAAADQLAHCVHAAYTAMAAADAIRRTWQVPAVAASGLRPLVGTDSAGAPMWCTSCMRDAAYCEPASERGLCRWCRDFQRRWGCEPPRTLLARRHRGQRIYEGDVVRALHAAGITHG